MGFVSSSYLHLRREFSENAIQCQNVGFERRWRVVVVVVGWGWGGFIKTDELSSQQESEGSSASQLPMAESTQGIYMMHNVPQ